MAAFLPADVRYCNEYIVSSILEGLYGGGLVEDNPPLFGLNAYDSRCLFPSFFDRFAGSVSVDMYV